MSGDAGAQTRVELALGRNEEVDPLLHRDPNDRMRRERLDGVQDARELGSERPAPRSQILLVDHEQRRSVASGQLLSRDAADLQPLRSERGGRRPRVAGRWRASVPSSRSGVASGGGDQIGSVDPPGGAGCSGATGRRGSRRILTLHRLGRRDAQQPQHVRDRLFVDREPATPSSSSSSESTRQAV